MKKLFLIFFTLTLFMSCQKKMEQECEAPSLEEAREIEAVIDEEPREPRPDRSGEAYIAFFYLETCPSCEEYVQAKKIEAMLKDAAKKGYFPWTKIHLVSTNVLQAEHLQQLQAYIEEGDFPDVSRSLPVIFVNKELVVGYDEIEILVKGLTDY